MIDGYGHGCGTSGDIVCVSLMDEEDAGLDSLVLKFDEMIKLKEKKIADRLILETECVLFSSRTPHCHQYDRKKIVKMRLLN